MNWIEDVERKFLYSFGQHVTKQVNENCICIYNSHSLLKVIEVDGSYEVRIEKQIKDKGRVYKDFTECNVKELTSSIATNWELGNGWNCM